MKLFELSGATEQVSNNNAALRAVVINEMRLAAPIFEFAEFYTMSGNADAPRKSASVAGGTQRALNANYTPQEGSPSFGAVALKIYGDTVFTDQAHERRGQDIGSERVRQLRSFAQGLGRHVQDHIVNGDATGTPTQFDGFKFQVDASHKLTVNAGVDGFVIALGNSDDAKRSQQLFKKALDNMIAKVVGGPSCLVMGPDMVAVLEAIGMEWVRTTTLQEALTQNFLVYGGLRVPIVNAGYKKDGTSLVIGLNETKGASTDCTSIYAVKFGEKENVTLATNVGIEVKDLGLVGQQYQTSVDFDIDLEILNPAAAWRLEGLRLA